MFLAVVVVLYRKNHDNSPALRSLLAKLSEIESPTFKYKIFVWNNSPEFSSALKNDSVTWLEGKNVRLPTVYNAVADMAFSAGADALLLSDDDTDYSHYDFPRNLEIVREFLADPNRRDTIGCFIPKIISGGRLVSPGGRRLFRGYLLEQVTSGLVDSHNLLAINSGTLITRACYERMRPLYDERLNFYGTDTDFFVRHENYYSQLYVFDSTVNHSLSADSNESPDRMLFRWHDNIQAMNVIFERTSFRFKLLMHAYYFLIKVKLAIRFRDKRFLKI